MRDYLSQSLENGNALEANLGSLNSGLMVMALRLEAMITHGMEQGPSSKTTLEPLMPAIDMYLRFTRQIDRFAQLERRLTEPRQSATNKQSMRPVNLPKPQPAKIPLGEGHG